MNKYFASFFCNYNLARDGAFPHYQGTAEDVDDNSVRPTCAVDGTITVTCGAVPNVDVAGYGGDQGNLDAACAQYDQTLGQCGVGADDDGYDNGPISAGDCMRVWSGGAISPPYVTTLGGDAIDLQAQIGQSNLSFCLIGNAGTFTTLAGQAGAASHTFNIGQCDLIGAAIRPGTPGQANVDVYVECLTQEKVMVETNQTQLQLSATNNDNGMCEPA